jgi:hypothetical protein
LFADGSVSDSGRNKQQKSGVRTPLPRLSRFSAGTSAVEKSFDNLPDTKLARR